MPRGSCRECCSNDFPGHVFTRIFDIILKLFPPPLFYNTPQTPLTLRSFGLYLLPSFRTTKRKLSHHTNHPSGTSITSLFTYTSLPAGTDRDRSTPSEAGAPNNERRWGEQNERHVRRASASTRYLHHRLLPRMPSRSMDSDLMQMLATKGRHGTKNAGR